MKKLLAAILTFLMVLSLAGCGSNPSTPTFDSQPPEDNGLGDYPKETIQVIVPYAPGGGSDVLARAMISSIDLPVPMVAVNVEGASGLIGTMQGYESKPDGYTIIVQSAHDLMGFSLSGTTDVSLFEEMETICDLVAGFNMILTNKESGWNSIDEMVEFAKANPGVIKWSCTGSQGLDYATTQMVVDGLGLTDLVTIVPYDGGGAGSTALLGNHVQVSTLTNSDSAGGIASGDFVPLMVVSDKRLEDLPDVPTTRECGVEYDLNAPRGFYAPPGTPEAIVKYLEAAMEEVSKDPEFIQKVGDFGLLSNFRPGAEAHQRMLDEVSILQPVFDAMKG